MDSSEFGAPPATRAVLMTMVGLLAVLALRSAWVAEDAYITLRTVDNWVNGYGLRWNIGERVQAYTHPLWMLALSAVYVFTKEAFVSAALLGVGATVAAALVLARLARSTLHALIALALLVCSRSFIDYSTSGLENPLSHLLIAVFVLLYAARGGSITHLTLAAALMALNRIDSVLLVLPALVHGGLLSTREDGLARTLRRGLLGLSPLLAWLVFSLAYYGFLVPNTAFAKLNTGIDASDLMAQGALYLLQTIAFDPALVMGVVIAIGVACATRDRRALLLVCGLVLYLAYVVRIGGDFMAGRFLTVPLMLAACVVARTTLPLDRTRTAAAMALPLVLLWMHPHAAEPWPVADWTRTGVADERTYYRQTASPMMMTRGGDLPASDWANQGRHLRAIGTTIDIAGHVGYRGFFAGPDVHIVDLHALADALLARLPARNEPRWRVGHYARVVPEGYGETIVGGTCVMPDENLCEYYARLRLIIAGDLWSRDRWSAIVGMHVGAYDRLIDSDRYRYPDVLKLTHEHVRAPVDAGGWNAPGMHILGNGGAEIALGQVTHAGTIGVRLDANDAYHIVYRLGTEQVGEQRSRRATRFDRYLDTPPAVRTRGFDTLIVRPVQGDGSYSIGHLRLWDDRPAATGTPAGR